MRQTTRSRNLATQSRLTPWITLTAKQANPMENSYGGNPYGKNQKPIHSLAQGRNHHPPNLTHDLIEVA